jgi:chromosome segregation ATPase
MKLMNVIQHMINRRISTLEVVQREVSAQHSAIQVEWTKMHASVHQMEVDLSELATEIRIINSMCADVREMLSRRADERLSQSERCNTEQWAEIEAVRRRCDGIEFDVDCATSTNRAVDDRDAVRSA